MGKTKRVGFYLRVSTAGQTVENQRLELQRVAEHRGWQVVGEYVDHGVSGSKGRDKRPEFDRLARDASQGKIDMVAAWSIDRLGRSVQHLVSFLEELRNQNVGMYLHHQQIDTSTAAGKAFLQMAMVFAEFEREVIRERVFAGLARAKDQGKALGRPSNAGKDKEAERDSAIRARLTAGAGKLRIARDLKCGTSTVQRIAKAMKAA